MKLLDIIFKNRRLKREQEQYVEVKNYTLETLQIDGCVIEYQSIKREAFEKAFEKYFSECLGNGFKVNKFNGHDCYVVFYMGNFKVRAFAEKLHYIDIWNGIRDKCSGEEVINDKIQYLIKSNNDPKNVGGRYVNVPVYFYDNILKKQNVAYIRWSGIETIESALIIAKRWRMINNKRRLIK